MLDSRSHCFDWGSRLSSKARPAYVENPRRITLLAGCGQAVTPTAAEQPGKAAEALSRAETAVAGKEQPSVVELLVEGNTMAAIGAGIEFDMIKTAGGKNVFSPSDPAFATFFSAVISPETLVHKNPEVIVFTTVYCGKSLANP